MLGMGLFFLDEFSLGGLLGNLLALFSGVALAGMMLAQRNNPQHHHEASIFWGNVWVVIIGFTFTVNAPFPTLNDWFMLSFLGFIQIGLGYMLFTFGLKRVSALESSLVAMLEPILNPDLVKCQVSSPSWGRELLLSPWYLEQFILLTLKYKIFF
jgi:drug/metabolite transporter (DMT)-like permease